jgi:hypothetical protein
LSALAGSVALVLAGAASAEFPYMNSGPSWSGTPQEGQTLQGHNGLWLYADGTKCPPGLRPDDCKYAYTWQRCNPDATGCADIPGATSFRYLLREADVGQRVRYVEWVTKTDCNAHGLDCRTITRNAVSAPTPVIAARPEVIPAAEVTGDHRLRADMISPARLGRGVFTVRIRIRDDRGFRIAGALVQATVIPEYAVRPSKETRSNADGWAAFTFKVTKRFRPGTLWFFVTARKPGESLYAGASTSTLFRLKVRRPPRAGKR